MLEFYAKSVYIKVDYANAGTASAKWMQDIQPICKHL